MRSSKYHSLFVLVLALGNCYQLTAQEVVSSQGGSFVSESASIDFTIGEVLVDSYATNLVTYTQGFHQSYVIELSFGTNEPQPKVNVLIYPNPASDFLKIEMENHSGSKYLLHDLLGKLVKEGSMDTSSTILDIANLADGAFRLSITDRNNTKLNSFLIIKKK